MVEEMGSYNRSWNAASNGTVQLGVPYLFFELILDPVVAQLNNDTFGDVRTGETWGSDVVCRDYRYLANNSFSAVDTNEWDLNFRAGSPAFRWLRDRLNHSVENTCLVLLDANFGSSTLEGAQGSVRFSSSPLEGAQGSARSGWQKYKPHAHMLWCSTNRTQVGPGWLPLTMHTGLSLLRQFRPKAFYNIANITSNANMYDILHQQAPGDFSLKEGEMRRCPDFGFNNTTRGYYGLDTLQMLPDHNNAWSIKDGDAKYDFPGNHGDCSMEDQESKFSQVFRYADSLGWDRSGFLFRPGKNGEYRDPALCRDTPVNTTLSSHRPLQGAKLYASLRFQCSSLSKGVLCDFGVDPPLAVSPDGKYLNKKNMPDMPDVVTFGSPQTATSVEWAVKGMIIAAIVSNLASVVFLSCWPGNMQLDAHMKLSKD